ncbi:MAG: hypothetical protein MJZ24_01550 [Paludibacteraceae bacterium]|nr:hypothetical protein [Paludibacteraceae bacterium]
MITATIGKIFLEAYNKKYGTKYDAQTFFVEVYHPLFFDSNKYLQWVQNSPFVQMKGKQKIETLTTDERKEKLHDFISKVEECKVPDASIAPGFPASEEKEYATTSGQVTNLNFKIKKDDIFFSWIGSSLGVGLQGGISVLFSESEILLDLFEGWQLYRKVITENEKMRGNQVNTWNGQWLSHRYGKNFHPTQPMAEFKPFETTKDGMSVATETWTRVLVGIASHFTNPKMMGYVYNLGQTNTTIGFIPFSLGHIRKTLQLYTKLFGAIESEKAESLWDSEKGLKACCQKGSIGIEAMQPKGLTQYMKADKDKTVKLPKFNDKNKTNFHTYQIWLLAMLNNEELWEKSKDFAHALQVYVNSDKKLSTKKSNLVKNILESTSKKAFLSALSEIASNVESFSQIEENAKIIHMMPNDNVPYYLTLIRFHYAGLDNKCN